VCVLGGVVVAPPIFLKRLSAFLIGKQNAWSYI